MKISIYTTAWNILKYGFDYKDAFTNWSRYADEISVSVGSSDDGTLEAIMAEKNNFPLSIITPPFGHSDPFFYGRMENSALQNCTGSMLVQQNLDERWAGDKTILQSLGEHLRPGILDAFFVPTIDLYGDKSRFSSINRKWYIHARGLFRGSVKFGIKPDGHPDYNKTSTDELIDKHGDLARTYPLLEDLSIEALRGYVKAGMPYTFHLGYLNLKDRAERAIWWKSFWEKATNGDKNAHITSAEELMKRGTEPHGLRLWEGKNEK